MRRVCYVWLWKNGIVAFRNSKLKKGGIVKAFPVDQEQIKLVKEIASDLPDIEFNATLKDKYNDYGEDWLIEIKKKQ